MKKNVAIIGAGTVGLSVALRSLEVCENINVTIIAAEFLSGTTSFGSGGLWEPYQVGATPSEKISGWGRYTFNYYKDLYYSPDAAAAGVQLATCIHLLEASEDYKEPMWKDIVFNFKSLERKELACMGIPLKYHRGMMFESFVVDQRYYMQYVTKHLQEVCGATIKQCRLSSIHDVLSEGLYDVVVNCSGLGSSTAAPDESMVPIRGQVVRVK